MNCERMTGFINEKGNREPMCTMCLQERDEEAKREDELLIITTEDKRITGQYMCTIEKGKDGEEWECIDMCPDSGACEHVVNPEAAETIPIEESEGSRTGRCWRAANHTRIRNQGQKRMAGWPEGWKTNETPAKITVQVGKITKPLAAVIKMVKNGNRVVFDDDGTGNGTGSYIENKKTGKRIMINEKNGAYVFRMWIKVNKKDEKEIEGKTIQIGQVEEMHPLNGQDLDQYI